MDATVIARLVRLYLPDPRPRWLQLRQGDLKPSRVDEHQLPARGKPGGGSTGWASKKSPLLRGSCRARGGTQTASQAWQTLGTRGNTRNPIPFGQCTTESDDQSVGIVRTAFLTEFKRLLATAVPSLQGAWQFVVPNALLGQRCQPLRVRTAAGHDVSVVRQVELRLAKSAFLIPA